MIHRISILIASLALGSPALAAEPFLTVTAVGDMMLGSLAGGNYLPPEGANALLLPAKATLRRGDIVFGNIEGVLMDETGTPKAPIPGESYFVFRSPERYAEAFRNAGFNLVSVANNHANDFGVEGRKSTASALDRVGIPYAGMRDGPSPWALRNVRGKTVALVAFGFEKETYDLRKIDEARALVKRADAIADIVIVSFHGGGEGPRFLHVTREQEYYEGDRGNPYAFAHAVIDAGADLVIGHSPHVPRAMELYKGRLIAYSLGNFATYRRFNLSGPNGLAPLLEAKLAVDGSFAGGKIHSFTQTSPGGPKPDPQNRAATLIRQLANKDFPESPLKVESDGTLR